MKLLIFDASNYMFRAYFASVRRLADGSTVPIITTRAGEPTNAIFFFTNMVIATVSQVRPDAVAFAYDCRRTASFRFTELLATYKAHRPPLPEAFRQQIPVCREIVEAMGYRSYAADTFEADDVIATLTHVEKRLGGRLVTVVVEGSVSAVTAALEAGVEAAKTVGNVACAEVIARPHEDIVRFIKTDKGV